jgi:hypothetical protein
MSSIPPTFLGGLIQTQGAQTHASQRKAGEAATQTDRAGPAFANELQDVIGSSERDSQVFSDGEGSGGQGRSYDSDEEKPAETDAGNSPSASAGLDMEA